jgi:hypothetical protein
VTSAEVAVELLVTGSPKQITMFRIDNSSDGQVRSLRLSGRIQSQHMRELQIQIESSSQKTALDLEDVKLVDRATVQFLGCCESKGLDLLNCPVYVREWIAREKHRSSVERRR